MVTLAYAQNGINSRLFIAALFVYQKIGNSLKIFISKGWDIVLIYPCNGTLYSQKIECRYNEILYHNENEQNTVICSSVWISKQCRGNVGQKKPNSKRAHTVWIYLIKVQKQEEGISSDRSWIVAIPGGRAVTERDQKWVLRYLSCPLLIWEVITQVCSVCENLWCGQYFLFCIAVTM